MAIIGIDLGTTNSLVACYRDDGCVLIPNAFGEVLTPSVVSIGEANEVYIGRIAKERLISHPEETVTAFKRFIGTEKKYYLKNKFYTPVQLSAILLRRLKEDAENFLGEQVTEAIISVPAYFNDYQRMMTKRAGQLAGLKVERLVNEPSAAALSCSLDLETEQTLLVFDFGGGTLDVSIVEVFDQIVEIVAVAGDNQLGGIDFDQAMVECFCQEHGLIFDGLDSIEKAVLLKRAEICKIELTKKSGSWMKFQHGEKELILPVSNQRLVEFGSSLFERMGKVIKRALADSGKDFWQIDDVVLVGGSCKMPVVKQYLEHFLSREVACFHAPDEIVARGAGVYAGIKERKGDIKDVVLTDICPFTLGIAITNEVNPENHLMSPIIERNTVLPSSRVQRYYTAQEGQIHVDVEIYQGEDPYVKNNVKLGQLSIQVPYNNEKREGIDIRFSYDINGILEVDVQNVTGQFSEKKVLTDKKLNMTEEEILTYVREMDKLKIHPRDKEENQVIAASLESLFAETLGIRRQQAGETLQWFLVELESQDDGRVRKARERAITFLRSMGRRI